MRIIAQMVARNEANRHLVEVLDHLNMLADLIIFTDDCSDDNTVEIAREKGCKVDITPWETSHFGVNEGELRNYAWQRLCAYAEPGDWVLAIDADEKFFGIERLYDYLYQNQYDVLGVQFYHMWNEKQYRCDKAWRPHTSSRLFRFYPNGTFNIRKLACGSEPTYVQDLVRNGRVLWGTPFKMQHLGYVRDEDKEAKYRRYMALDGGDFHARAHIESIMDSSPTLLDWLP